VSDKRKKKQARRAARKEGQKTRRDSRVVRDAEGRTHLLVQRDPDGRVVALGLSAPLFVEAWQNDVALAAASTANQLMSRGHTLENAVELGKNAMAGTSKIADGALRLAVEQRPACHSGCAHCCYQAVGVSAPEVFAIYEHLRTTLSVHQLDSVAQRIRDADDRTRGMTSAERLAPDLPCPFLEDQRCSIYAVRPLACRGANSLDATECERTLWDPDARARFLSGELSVPCFLEPIRAFHAVAAGMQLALHELHGLKVVPLELTAAMRVLFDEPETVPVDWLRGEDPLAEAEGADNTNNPLIRALSGRRA
jgi:hypothetical protein